MKNATRNRLSLIILLTLTLIATTFSLSLVAPPAPSSDHRFDTNAAVARLSRILGDERPHPIDTAANDAVRERLLTEIRNLGFDPIVRDDFRCTPHFGGVCGRVRNVMFWAVPPTDETTPGVALMSHYDSVPAGPGAGDDGAGVAVGLEIARLLKGRDDLRPILVLITDGEEIGLLGAESFVHTDPLAARIDAVVNVEARGVRGPISMFQTSNPNGADIAAIAKVGRTALANTLSSDIYDAMPNDTDVSRFLDADAPRQVDATNFAFILGDSFYHTPGDNLANLDPSSVFHSGINALETVERFASRPISSMPEGRRLYFDILTRGVISVPDWTGIGVILLSGLLSIAALIRTGTWRGWRGWTFVPLALIGAGLAAVTLSAGVGAIKPSGAYSPAHPWALRGALSAVAILIALGVTAGLKGRPDVGRVGPLLKSWLWLSVLGTVGWLLFPGSVTIFAGTLFVASFAVIAILFKRDRVAVGISGIAALMFILVNLPMPGFALAALGGMAAPFAALWAIPTVIIAVALPTKRGDRLPLLALTGFTVALITAAVIVPVHTKNAPRALTVQHISSPAGNFVQLLGRGSPPQSMLDSGSFTLDDPVKATLPAYARARWTRPSATAPDISVTIETLSNHVEADLRRVSLRIIAPTADRLHVAPQSRETLWTALSINGVDAIPTQWGTRIAGRTARDVQLDITLPANAPIGQMAVIRFGLGADVSPVADSRPNWTLPRQTGDAGVRLIDIESPR